MADDWLGPAWVRRWLTARWWGWFYFLAAAMLVAPVVIAIVKGKAFASPGLSTGTV
jgi:hypothetical protein